MKMKEISEFLVDSIEGVDFCLYERDGNLFVEVSRKEMSRTAAILKTKYGKVALFDDIAGNLGLLSDCVIIKQMVSGSTLLDMGGVPVPAIEKHLVDMVADAVRLSMDEVLVQRSYQRAFEVYEINKTRLLRYAGRRNQTVQVQRLISNLDTHRINLISRLQEAISLQPIEKAWLFGSFARGEERIDSDIDLLVEFKASDHVSVFGHTKAALNIGDIVGRDIDLVTDGTLLPSIEAYVNKDKYIIYERAHT